MCLETHVLPPSMPPALPPSLTASFPVPKQTKLKIKTAPYRDKQTEALVLSTPSLDKRKVQSVPKQSSRLDKLNFPQRHWSCAFCLWPCTWFSDGPYSWPLDTLLALLVACHFGAQYFKGIDSVNMCILREWSKASLRRQKRKTRRQTPKLHLCRAVQHEGDSSALLFLLERSPKAMQLTPTMCIPPQEFRDGVWATREHKHKFANESHSRFGDCQSECGVREEVRNISHLSPGTGL